MTKTNTIVAAAVIVALLAGCAPLAEQEAAVVTKADLPSNYIKITAPAASRGGPSRSLTGTQMQAVVNFIEVAIEELEDITHSSPPSTNDDDWYPKASGSDMRAARALAGQSIILSVKRGVRYQLLFLRGYTVDGGRTAILYDSGYAYTGVIQAGENPVVLTTNAIQCDPADLTDGWSLNYGTSVVPARDTSNTGQMKMELPKQSDAAFTSSGPTVTVRVKGMESLMQASAGRNGYAAGYATLQQVPQSNIALPATNWKAPTITLRPMGNVTSAWSVIAPTWAQPQAALSANVKYKKNASTGANGLTEIQWTVPKTSFPDNDGDGLMNFELEYYAFTRPAIAAWTSGGASPVAEFNNTDAAAKGFTKWIIRNGLDVGVDTPNNSGGGIWVQIGGGGSYDPTQGGSSIVIYNP